MIANVNGASWSGAGEKEEGTPTTRNETSVEMYSTDSCPRHALIRVETRLTRSEYTIRDIGKDLDDGEEVEVDLGAHVVDGYGHIAPFSERSVTRYSSPKNFVGLRLRLPEAAIRLLRITRPSSER